MQAIAPDKTSDMANYEDDEFTVIVTPPLPKGMRFGVSGVSPLVALNNNRAKITKVAAALRRTSNTMP